MSDPLALMGEAIAALGRGDPAAARAATSAAASADPALGALADSVGMATSELESDGKVSAAAWNSVADACPAELRGMIEEWRR